MADTKLSQALHIEPSKEISFKGPFTDVVNATLTLRNLTDKPICFKVKTTAPKQYCVRPNSGIVYPSETKIVTVMLQPFDPNATETHKHKFMVQTCFAPADHSDLDQVWKVISPSDLMFSKLMVVFEENKSLTGSIGGVAREESPVAVKYGQQSYANSSASDSNEVTAEVSDKSQDDKLRHEVNRLEKERKDLMRERDDMFKKVAKLQSQSEPEHVGVPTLQVILMAIAALLIGLIIGKLF